MQEEQKGCAGPLPKARNTDALNKAGSIGSLDLRVPPLQERSSNPSNSAKASYTSPSRGWKTLTVRVSWVNCNRNLDVSSNRLRHNFYITDLRRWCLRQSGPNSWFSPVAAPIPSRELSRTRLEPVCLCWLKKTSTQFRKP